MMYPELYQYLLLHKQLPVPGVGTFSLERKPAKVDFPNKLLFPPVYSFELKQQSTGTPHSFFAWLAAILGIRPNDAVIRFNDFAFTMKKQIDAGGTIDWKGVGVIKKGLGGEVKFTPAVPDITEKPIPAVKVLREKAAHTVRVGEEEKTSAEMEAMLSYTAETKSYWWAWALALGLLSVIFIGWYLSENGVDTGSVSSTQKLHPAEATVTYKTLE